jgi:carbon-monoxide dehydrogenase large subunit
VSADPRAIGILQAPRLLRGGGRYVDDVPAAGALHAAFVRSPHPHAVVAGIDAAAAAAGPGVAGVFVQADLERIGVHPLPVGWCIPGQRSVDSPLMADGRVRYVGQPVAVVLADDPYRAEDAAWLVDVAYEPLPALADVDAALDADAVRLHDGWPDNVMAQTVVEQGDLDAAFASAAVVIGDRFHVGRAAGVPIEARGALARVDEQTGRLELTASLQSVHHARSDLAEVLGRPESAIRVVAPDVGGSFGVKDHLSAEEAVVAALALHTGRPVKWIEDRWEHLAAAAHSREQVYDVELAAGADGSIAGLRGRLLFDAGAHSGNHGMGTALYAASVLPGPYRFSAYRLEVVGVVTNKAPSAAYRGYGGPEAAFVIEGLVDALARRLRLDPGDVRRRNLVPPDAFPYRNPAGLVYDPGDYRLVLDRAVELAGAAAAEDVPDGWRRGVGTASIVQRGGFGPSRAAVAAGMRFGGFEMAIVRMDATGKAALFTGLSTQGQGIDTALAQICAERLGLDPERDVTVTAGDTAVTPFSPVGAIASRGAAVGGSAVFRAATALREKLIGAAALMLEAAPGDIRLESGVAAVQGTPDARIPIARVARALHTGEIVPEGAEPGLESAATYEPADETTSYGAHAAVVHVQPATGRVRVVRYVAVTDCGVMINPRIVAGQIAGGAVQGIGGALYEELAYGADGQLLSPTLGEYRLPTSADVPSIDLEFLETPTPLTPTGARGAGEIGITGPGPVIAGAVADALGPSHPAPRRLPLTPDRVWELASRRFSESENPGRRAGGGLQWEPTVEGKESS